MVAVNGVTPVSVLTMRPGPLKGLPNPWPNPWGMIAKPAQKRREASREIRKLRGERRAQKLGSGR